MFTLRPYQREGIDAVFGYWSNGGGNPLLAIPTGGGKSLIIATLIREILEQFPGMRIAVVTHTRELIAQNFKELVRYWPQAPAGIYSAGLARRDARARILFCGIQSVAKKVRQIGGVDVLIVDEAHLIPRSSDTLYGKFIADLREITPDMRILGTTATPYRLDSGRLDRGEDRMFDEVVYEANIGDLIRDGYLSPLVSKATHQSLNVDGVARRGGEFIASALADAVDQDWITRAAVAETIEYGTNRKAWLAFCVSVDHAMHVRDEMRNRGISCEAVHGGTPTAERDRIIKTFAAGQIQCLTSVAVLTTGFNVPHVDLIALYRPTLSAGLYTQMVGRALRTAPGKTDALILDFAGNVRRHGPVDAINITNERKKKKEGAVEVNEIRAKECPDCQTLVALNARECPTCGHSWKSDDGPKHDATADGDSYILSSAAPDWLRVGHVKFYRHEKPGGLPSLRVEYQVGIAIYRKWICLEHPPGSLPRRKAGEWWSKMGGGAPPETVFEALSRWPELRLPDEIRVKPAGKFFEIIGERHDKVNNMAEAAE